MAVGTYLSRDKRPTGSLSGDHYAQIVVIGCVAKRVLPAATAGVEFDRMNARQPFERRDRAGKVAGGFVILSEFRLISDRNCGSPLG